MNIEIVRPEQTDAVWEFLAPRVTECLREQQADITAADLWIQCRQNSAFVILISNEGQFVGAIVCRFETWPDGAVLRAIVAVGDGIEGHFEELYAWCETFARNMGAGRFVIVGTRPGWGRKIKRSVKVLYTYVFEVDP